MHDDIISDNRAYFVVVEKELGKLTNQIVKDSKFVAIITGKKIKRMFNPPYTPNFKRVFETMVKAAKGAKVAILGNSDVTDEELVKACS